jgi:Na+/proline symporter
MSSLDSGINSVATVLTVDVIKRRDPKLSPQREVRIARTLTLIIGLLLTAAAFGVFMFLSSMSPEERNALNIISNTARTFNCALGPLAAMFVVGMFLPYVRQAAMIVSTLAGTSIAVAVAWWSELITLAGFEGTSPSPFLVTPIAFTATVLLAAVLGALPPKPIPDRVRALTWRAVVFGPDRGDDV